MGLNDDVDKEHGPIDRVVLVADGTQVPEGNTVNETDVFDEPTVAGELPKFSGVFDIQTEAVGRMGDLSNMRTNLSRSCSVCMEDATALDTIIPGFINDDRPIGLFSEDKSLTQYEQTMSAIDGELDSQYQAFKTTTQEVAKNLYTFASEASKQYATRYPGLLAGVNRAIAKLLFVTNKDEVGEIGYIFGNNQRWSKLLGLHLSDICGDYAVPVGDATPQTGFNGTFIEPFLQRFAALTMDNNVKNTIDALVNNQNDAICAQGGFFVFDENKMELTASTRREDNTPCTLGMIFRLLRSNTLVIYIQALLALHQNRIHVLTGIAGQIAEVDASKDALQAKINRMSEMSSIVAGVHFDSIAILGTLSVFHKLMCALKDMTEAMTQTQL